MTEKEFVEIIASALIMVLRAINRRYGLRLWILTRQEKRAIQKAFSDCENGQIKIVTISRFFHDDDV